MSQGYRVLVERLKEAFTQQRYNPEVVQNYCRNADYFLSYLVEQKIALEAVTPTIVSNCLRLARFGSSVSAMVALPLATG
ncbi:hypothetical protein [Mesorhizobium delmotii]|uniref:Uncharacterized protein n=1 Tax=Mesorhizobium delmotii TaxID=1631247 RepID=A0A2P9AT13_9HYPH|nr:hypothetical protein [Mesorhizobium delmotii]SJM34307.1 hypothetical protein BQ8482_400036 [Mesorhizobium delmotii]